MWVLLAVAAIGGIAILGQTAPVPANTVPPPGLSPRAHACYESCVLPNYIVAGDFNMDGWLDLAVSCIGNNVVDLYRNQNGIFQGPVPINVNPGPVALITGHIGNYDGYPDIGVLSTLTIDGQQPVTQIRGGANFPANATTLANPPAGLPRNGLVHMAGGYFDNNNRLDIAVVRNVPGAYQLYVYDDRGNPMTPGAPNNAAPIVLPGPPVFVSVADFDQNGWPDIAVLCAANPPAHPTATVTIYYNSGATANGGVRFAPAPNPLRATITNLWAPLVPTGMDVGDFNADGYPDIVVVGNVIAGNGQLQRGYAQILLNSVPTGTSSAVGLTAVLPAMPTWGFDARFVKVADFDGNGRDDFAVANGGSDTVTVFLTDVVQPLRQDHRPSGGNYGLCDKQMRDDLLNIQFKLFKIELKCGYFPIGLAAGDFDRNGKMDLAVALQSADKNLCAQNNSCIEVDFDIAGGFNANQLTHIQILGARGQNQEAQQCPACKSSPCTGNTPPKPVIQTGSGTKK